MAFSGGGDSLALLLAASAWARGRGRSVLALSVDHRLRPESPAWAAWCADRALRLGLPHRTLVWDADKPPSGLSAAARAARHARLAEAARAAGARVILMGHTADDVAEAVLMRRAGSSVPAPKVWAPSPAWPEGRGVFVLRPMLGLSRAELRSALAAAGETWLEDPANCDPASLRARARRQLAEGGFRQAPAQPRAIVRQMDLSGVAVGPAADLTLPAQAVLTSASPEKVLGAALLCASGGTSPPRLAALARLLTRIADGRPFRATLAGARIAADGESVHLVRDAADDRRSGIAELSLPPDRDIVWDGRIELRADVPGAGVRLLRGRSGALPPDLRSALRRSPPAARPAIPLVVHADGSGDCPTLAASPRVACRALSLTRLAAALGEITREADLKAHGETSRVILNGTSNSDEACL